MTLLMVAGWLSIVGCSGDAGYQTIDFSQTIMVPKSGDIAKAPGLDKLRVAVSAMISPKETVGYYHALLEYLGKRAGHSIELVQRKTYGEVNVLFQKGLIDIAFICSGPYAVGKEKFGFDILATPVVRGKPFYHAYLIVNQKSSFNSLIDLKGFKFAFTDPESNTGALVPNYWLALQDATAESFFGQVTYTYSHDNSILAVAKGLVDGASVDGHKWEYFALHNPVYTSMTRVIKKSQPFGSPPLVASAHLPEALKDKVRQAVLTMHTDQNGQQILGHLQIDRFTTPQEDWYQPVRQMYQIVHKRDLKANGAQKS